MGEESKWRKWNRASPFRLRRTISLQLVTGLESFPSISWISLLPSSHPPLLAISCRTGISARKRHKSIRPNPIQTVRHENRHPKRKHQDTNWFLIIVDVVVDDTLSDTILRSAPVFRCIRHSQSRVRRWKRDEISNVSRSNKKSKIRTRASEKKKKVTDGRDQHWNPSVRSVRMWESPRYRDVLKAQSTFSYWSSERSNGSFQMANSFSKKKKKKKLDENKIK